MCHVSWVLTAAVLTSRYHWLWSIRNDITYLQYVIDRGRFNLTSVICTFLYVINRIKLCRGLVLKATNTGGHATLTNTKPYIALLPHHGKLPVNTWGFAAVLGVGSTLYKSGSRGAVESSADMLFRLVLYWLLMAAQFCRLYTCKIV